MEILTEKYLDKKLDQKLDQHTRQIQRYIKMISEDFQSKLKPIHDEIVAIREKLDATFEMVGKNSEDIEMIKIDIAIIKNNIKKLKANKMNKGNVKDIKNNQKYKADLKELESLETRVDFLERKYATA